MREKEKENLIKTYFKQLTPEERIELIGDLKENYCFHCGIKEQANNFCQCWNDE